MTRLIPAIKRELSEAVERRRRRDAERALEDTRERMQFVMSTIGVGTWEIDLQLGSVLWSDVMETLHGVTRGTFARTLDAFLATVHPDDRHLVRQLATTGGAGSDGRLEYRAVWPDGTVHWIASIGRTVSDGNDPLHTVGVSIDITPQKSVEEQLRQSQKLDAIGRLAGGVAHDFNNVLTAILGYADLAAESVAPSEPLFETIHQISKAGERGAALTRQLLAFSRQQVLEPTLVDLNALVTDISHMLRRLIGEDITLSTRLAPGLGVVLADRSQLEQIVLNLAVNARDAMPSGGQLIIETVDAPLPDGDASGSATAYVTLTVRDTGTGMSEETQRRIFEPFFTTKEKGKGTGLGLSTVYGIVKQSGGHVRVSSVPGRGTAFTVSLPRASGGAVRDAVGVDTAGPPVVGTEQLLLVEDEPAIRKLSRLMLQRAGYNVVEAENPQQAEEAFTPAVDLLISDIVMPGVSGPVLFKRLAVRKPDLKVLFVSGYADDVVVREGVVQAGSGFLQKPFTKSMFLRKVREVLDADR